MGVGAATSESTHAHARAPRGSTGSKSACAQRTACAAADTKKAHEGSLASVHVCVTQGLGQRLLVLLSLALWRDESFSIEIAVAATVFKRTEMLIDLIKFTRCIMLSMDTKNIYLFVVLRGFVHCRIQSL